MSLGSCLGMCSCIQCGASREPAASMWDTHRFLAGETRTAKRHRLTSGQVSAWQGKDGKKRLLSANAGDARVILARGSKGIQLSEDHTPDV